MKNYHMLVFYVIQTYIVEYRVVVSGNTVESEPHGASLACNQSYLANSYSVMFPICLRMRRHEFDA